ncbi:MAG: phospholipase D-like domain-containing protein [Myxococcota bacterium]
MVGGTQRSRRDSQLRLDGSCVADGNSVSLLVDGGEAFPAMLEAIAGAEQTIVLESYTYADDATGRRFLDALIARARQGVTVRVLVDGVGSFGTVIIDNDFFAPLLEVGGKLAIYRPPKPWLPRWGFWKRDHRKILVVDDRVAFIGGLNIADEYAPESWDGGAWHDIHARVEGPVARELTKVINRTWTRVARLPRVPALGAAVPSGNIAVQVLESRLTRRYSIRRAYLNAIRRARNSIRISNAYFIPDQGVRRGLRNAVKRGVTVQLLLAGQTDLHSVRYASRATYRALMRCGIEIYEWDDRVLHAKCAVIDGCWCSIGSYNLDRRSLLHNLEANIACLDSTLGATMDGQFMRDIAHSQRIDLESWHRRPALEMLLEQLFYRLRYFL